MTECTEKMSAVIGREICEWMQNAVVGLNLCPFAKWPLERDQVRVFISLAEDVTALLVDLDKEVQRLDETDVSELETTLVVVPNFLQSFDAYLDMLDILEQSAWQEEYQIASFHPDYCFDGAEPDDRENLTNRAPYPIFHLLREDSVERALKGYAEPESIPEANIRRVESLTDDEVADVFPHIAR